jgi:hypothetical protein
MKTPIVLIAALIFFVASPSFADSKYEFRNRSTSEITVIMDTCREVHKIASGGTEVFVKANPFDQPTFRVVLDNVSECNESVRESAVVAKKVDLQNAISASGILEWDGSEIR